MIPNTNIFVPNAEICDQTVEGLITQDCHESVLTNILFIDSDIDRADFRMAVFSDTTFLESWISHTDFSQASFFNCSGITGCEIYGSSFRDCIFDCGVSITECTFDGCDFGEIEIGDDVCLFRNTFVDCDFTNMTHRSSFSKIFRECKFENCVGISE